MQPALSGRRHAAHDAPREPVLARELGRVRGVAPGPSLIVVAGVHGNEHAGTVAARRVIEALRRDAGRFGLRGELVAFSGNLAALRMKRRYQVKDLNRCWTEPRVAALHARDRGADDPEDAEQRELLQVIDVAIRSARGEVHFMDLHTTSAAGFPFVLFGDTLRQRRFAGALPIPLILGLEEQVDGVMSEYFTRRGCVTLAIEGGQHDDPASIENLESALWIGLVSAGLLDRGRAAAEHERSHTVLDARRGHLPRVMEVVERRAIRPEDEFRMEPGFANLARARRGQLLARDRRGEIRAPHDGMVILPLYQGQGEDGFFWGREVGERRLDVTAALRTIGVDRLLPYLPGLRLDPADAERLIVDPIVERAYPRELFHALGFRRVRRNGETLTIARQPE